MSSLNTALYIGTSGMQTAQVGLSTVSHNVVNANTPGYSRQTVTTASSTANGFGNGVTIQTIQRVSDSFLNARVLTANSAATYASTKSSYLSSLEGTFTSSNGSGGLESVVGNLITAMNNLSTDPSNSSLRRSAVLQANVTANAINNTATDLKNTAIQADDAITSELGTVNQLLKDIYTLNTQISQLTVTGNGEGNDLKDMRANKIAQLSEEFGIQATENTSSGAVRITTENGRKLVDESGYVQLSRGPVTSSGFGTIVAQNVLQDGSLSNTQLPIDTNVLTTGKIKALAEVRDTTIPNLLAQVDNFAKTFMAAVNQLSSQGTSSPPVKTLTSGNTSNLASTTTDLLTATGFTGMNGATINLSITNSLGTAINTTVGNASAVPPVAATSITFAPVAPATTMTLQDVADAINNSSVGNATLGGTAGVIATATMDANGKPVLTITAADPNSKVVASNVSGDALGILGMNNLFTGTDATTIAVRSDIMANPDTFPVARMNTAGGVSTTDNQNIIALSKLADTKLSFASAGGLGSQNLTAVSYLNTVSSNLAVSVSAAKDDETFTGNLQTQAQELATSVSGVNINDELAQMLVYQNSFQASARIISVVNDMMQTLMGIVQ